MRKEREEIGRANEKEMEERVIRHQPKLSSENKEMLFRMGYFEHGLKKKPMFVSQSVHVSLWPGFVHTGTGKGLKSMWTVVSAYFYIKPYGERLKEYLSPQLA